MAKAKRLIQSGQVQVLRNGFNYIVGHVVGDHGEYDTEISRDNPESRVITGWQCTCSPAGTRIVMADGSLKEIQDIETGDLVLTATGHASIVGRTMTRDYSGRMMGLKIKGSTETAWLTEDHKLITADIEPKEAGDWKTGDHSYMPQPQYVEQRIIEVADFVLDLVENEGMLYRANKGYGSTKQRKGTWTVRPYATTQKPIPARIALDENFARLAGLYLAEGIATPRGELRWSFNITEEHLADEVIERLKVYGIDNAKKKVARSCMTVAVQSKPLSLLFKALFGTGSRTKQLAMPIMAMESSALRVFFDAWCEGDGHETSVNRTTLTTSSDMLAMQARLILARLGRESVIRKQAINSSPLVPNGGSINVLNWRKSTTPGRRYNRWFENEQITQEMVVEGQQFTGKVYNFEVLGEHSYVLAPGIASLNCPWDQYAWQRTRKWKKFEGRPCAHVMALYWKALSTPLDEQLTEDQANAMGTGQKLPAPAVADHPPEIEQNLEQGANPAHDKLPKSFGPEGDIIQGDQMQMNLPPDAIGGPAGPAQAPLSPPPSQGPEPSGIIPPFPMEQMQMEWKGPGTTPGGQTSPPGAYSVPGAKPPNTPPNPIQMPGTLSRTATEFQPPQIVRLKNPMMGIAEGPEPGQYGDGEYREVPAGSTGEVLSQDPSTGWVEVIVPLDGSGYHEPFHVRCFVEPADIQATNQTPPGPFIRRR